MDASIAIKPVFDRFQSVVITSGVISFFFKSLITAIVILYLFISRSNQDLLMFGFKLNKYELFHQ